MEIVNFWLLSSDLFDLASDFPNSGIALIATAFFCDRDLCLSRATVTDCNTHGASSHIVNFIIFPNFNLDGLEAENLQRLGYLITAFDSLPVVGVCDIPVVSNMVV